MKRFSPVLSFLCIPDLTVSLRAEGNATDTGQFKGRRSPALPLSTRELQLALSIKCHAFYYGASVIADDEEHTFLGEIGSADAYDSIINKVSRHGGTALSQSIWNKVGRFGVEVARLSPLNPVTSSPTLVVKDGEVIGRLTVDDLVRGAIDPNLLRVLY